MNSKNLREWYETNKRDLPWRNTPNPYFIWISEVILQQTRVAQGLPYFLKFVEQFPDIQSLANASEVEILRLWQGLGYYSRARNMHKTAKIVAENHHGIFPNSYEKLLKLKGIGPYTASAIATFAFNEKVAVLDGNVMRVLARIYGFEGDISVQKNKNILHDIAIEILPNTNYSIHNQAIMEFGALQCMPKNPNCEICPFKLECIAFEQKKVSVLPFKKKAKKSIDRYFTYYIYRCENKIAMKKRISGDIWQGLYDFYLAENHLNDIVNLQNGVFVLETETIKHILSHQNLWIKFIVVEIKNLDNSFVNKNNLVFLDQNEINQIGVPIVIEKFLKKHKHLIFK